MYYEQSAYQKMYYYLFNAVEDAINTLSDSPHAHLPIISEVIHSLIMAQNSCEDIYLENEKMECDLMENADMPYAARMDHLEKMYFPEKAVQGLADEFLDQFDKENIFYSEDIDIAE